MYEATSLRNVENSDAPYMRKGQVLCVFAERERDFPARHNWLGDSWRPSVSRRGCISLAGRRRPTTYKQQLTFSSFDVLDFCLVSCCCRQENMAVIIDGMRNKTDRYSCPTCSTITWLLLCIALVMDGNVPLVRSQFIFREDPLGRNVPVCQFILIKNKNKNKTKTFF